MNETSLTIEYKRIHNMQHKRKYKSLKPRSELASWLLRVGFCDEWKRGLKIGNRLFNFKFSNSLVIREHNAKDTSTLSSAINSTIALNFSLNI